MIPEEDLMVALKEDSLFLENLIEELQNVRSFSKKQLESTQELKHWLLRTGMAGECYLAQNRIGFYADFT